LPNARSVTTIAVKKKYSIERGKQAKTMKIVLAGGSRTAAGQRRSAAPAARRMEQQSHALWPLLTTALLSRVCFARVCFVARPGAKPASNPGSRPRERSLDPLAGCNETQRATATFV